MRSEKPAEQMEGVHVEYINQISNTAESRSNLREVYSKILLCRKIVIKFWWRKLKFFGTSQINKAKIVTYVIGRFTQIPVNFNNKHEGFEEYTSGYIANVIFCCRKHTKKKVHVCVRGSSSEYLTWLRQITPPITVYATRIILATTKYALYSVGP